MGNLCCSDAPRNQPSYEQMQSRTPKKIRVNVCCVQNQESVQGLLDKLETMTDVDEVTFIQLPSIVRRMTEEVKRLNRSFMILCHSVNDRGFSITNVTGSLYDEFLKLAKVEIGAECIGIIAYDFSEELNDRAFMESRLLNFKSTQKIANECSCFALLAGSLSSSEFNLSMEDLEKMNNNFSRTKNELHMSNEWNKEPIEEAQVNVVVCCASSEETVQGLLNKLKDMPNVASVEFFPLEYNVKDMNKQVRSLKKKHFTILCHSNNNRGFSITDATDSLYDEFLQKTCKRIKQKRVGIIAYDFPREEIDGEKLKTRLDAFKSNQFTAFKRSAFATIGGKLSEPDIELREEQLKEIMRCFTLSTMSSKKGKKMLKGD